MTVVLPGIEDMGSVYGGRSCQIMRMMMECSGGMTDAHIARNLRITPKRLHETLSKMERDGIIASFMPAGKRVYFLTNRRDPMAVRNAGRTEDSD
ncbi:winged helix-turn-helix domain-containing protein [Candidatus Methanoprimaticola sp. MG2]|uniref:winged helix-turn-helix domain-containing protein n=1 Tax=Candidatus Methanoprimaticola sp. MG2 TaxID=3228838 RepID=UPI0039C5B236